MSVWHHRWVAVKFGLLLYAAYVGVAQSVDESLGTREAPPLWLSPICFLLCLCMGLMGRAVSHPRRWTERELWMSNPFANLAELRYSKAWRDNRVWHYVPFYHLGAVSFVAGGIAALATAAVCRPTMLGLAAVPLAMGAGLWVGVRGPDIRSSFTAERGAAPNGGPAAPLNNSEPDNGRHR